MQTFTFQVCRPQSSILLRNEASSQTMTLSWIASCGIPIFIRMKPKSCDTKYSFGPMNSNHRPSLAVKVGIRASNTSNQSRIWAVNVNKCAFNTTTVTNQNTSETPISAPVDAVGYLRGLDLLKMHLLSVLIPCEKSQVEISYFLGGILCSLLLSGSCS